MIVLLSSQLSPFRLSFSPDIIRDDLVFSAPYLTLCRDPTGGDCYLVYTRREQLNWILLVSCRK